MCRIPLLVHSYLKCQKNNKIISTHCSCTGRPHTLVRCRRIRTSSSEMCRWVSVRKYSKNKKRWRTLAAREEREDGLPASLDLTCRPWTDERSVRGRERKAPGLSFPSCRPDTPHQWIDLVLHISSTRSMVLSLQHKKAARNSVVVSHGLAGSESGFLFFYLQLVILQIMSKGSSRLTVSGIISKDSLMSPYPGAWRTNKDRTKIKHERTK